MVASLGVGVNMRKTILAVVCALGLIAVAPVPQAWACTNFLISRGASVDGSTMITYAADAHVLHVIDSTAGAPGYQPADVALSLETERFGPLQRAELVGSVAPLATQTGDGRITFTLRPDPVASLVLR